jgi:glycosyltransferase involved in cell wall biosynthesis
LNYHQFLVSSELGGAGLIGLNLAKWAIRNGDGATIWLPSSGRAAAATKDAGLRWRRYDLAAMKGGNARHALACLALGTKLCGRRGLVHIHMPAVYRLIRPALRLSRLRTVVHVHLEPDHEEMRWALKDPPDLIVPCASFMTGAIREALGERGRDLPIVAVPNAVDTELYSPGDKQTAKRKVEAPLDRPMVLMMANLAPHKGQETAIRAIAELKKRGTIADCWLAGVERDGGHDYEDRLKLVAQEMNVAETVRFLGFRHDGADLMRAADFLLLPSTKEGLPLSILEAQAAKVPVLAAPTAGVPEVVSDGKTGFLIPAADALTYANRIELLLDNAGLHHEITERAYDNVRRDHTWPVYCERIGQLYTDLMNHPRREFTANAHASIKSA